VVAPHQFPLQRVAPATAAAVWLLALGLRAVVALAAAVLLFLYLPSVGLLHVATHWCFHILLPRLAEHLGMHGHSIADLASVVPALTLAGSVVWMAFGLAWAAVRLRLFLRRRSRGSGPLGSTVVDDDAVIVALTGIGRGTIVVSRAALEVLDGDELAASVAHERGHLRRGHRPILIAARTLAAIGRPIPGTRTAERELAFSLERDADEYAVRETHDPLALASAICKAAADARAPVPAVVGLRGGGNLMVRLEHLMNGGRQRSAARLERTTRVLAAVLAVSVLSLAFAVPAFAVGDASPRTSAHLVDGCVH
jgi:Zn-dependent protease with chaperone function